jgi:uncharacterized membrane protein YhaH (DUF805 family)
MQTAVKTVLSKYATFSGRAARPEFWWFTLAVVILSVVLSIIEGGVLAPMLGFEAFAEEAGEPLRWVASLILFLPSLAVAVRRLHDIDRSGWWYLIILVPIIGPLILLYWYIQPGTDGSNQFG